MNSNLSVKQDNYSETLKSYIVGFILSCLLTVAAYYIVEIQIHSNHPVFSQPFLIFGILGFAVIQIFVQLFFFLGLGRSRGKRLYLAVFMFTVLIVIIIVGGSLWIMTNLNYHMMQSPAAIKNYMNTQTGF